MAISVMSSLKIIAGCVACIFFIEKLLICEGIVSKNMHFRGTIWVGKQATTYCYSCKKNRWTIATESNRYCDACYMTGQFNSERLHVCDGCKGFGWVDGSWVCGVHYLAWKARDES